MPFSSPSGFSLPGELKTLCGRTPLKAIAHLSSWWITGLIYHRYDLGWLIPFLIYLALTLRLVFLFVPITIITRPMCFIWSHTARPFVRLIPDRLRIPSAALLTIAVILVGSFVSKESQDNTRENRAVSLFGLIVFLFCLWLTSRSHRKVNWHTVIVGMLVQFIIALFVLRTKAGYDIFNFISELARELLGFAKEGVEFLTDADIAAKSWFLVSVIPAIIFFVSLVQLLYYAGLIQWFVKKFAVFFFWSMRVSGAEAVVAAASPFIGQGESAMLIKPFIQYLTMAEIHQVMTSGFATIAGSVLIAYISMGVNPQALISSCVMSIPASLATSKLRWPEEEETLTAGRVTLPEDEDHKASNALHAFTNGTWLGLKIAGMIGATLLCILSLIGLVNGLLTWWGRYLNINDPPLTLEMIVGYVCYPIAFLLGVDRTRDSATGKDDMLKVAKLIGLKLVAVCPAPNPYNPVVVLTSPNRTNSSPTTNSNTKATTTTSPTDPGSSPPTRSAASPISAPSVTRSVCLLRLPRRGLAMFLVSRLVLCLRGLLARLLALLLRVC